MVRNEQKQSKKVSKQSKMVQNNQKSALNHQMGGAREARAPHLVFSRYFFDCFVTFLIVLTPFLIVFAHF